MDGPAVDHQLPVYARGSHLVLEGMVSINVKLTLFCLATTPVLWIVSTTFARQVRPAHDRSRELVDEMLLVLTENVRGVQVVQGFARQPEEIAKFRAANRAVRDQRRWITWRVSLFSPTAEMLMTINMAALLGYGGWLVIHDRLALGSGLIVFSGLLQQFSTQVTKVTDLIDNVLQSLAGAQRVFAVLDAPQEIRSKPAARSLSRVNP